MKKGRKKKNEIEEQDRRTRGINRQKKHEAKRRS